MSRPCANCGKTLPHYQWAAKRDSPSEWGYDGNGIFCTLRCGYQYGLRAQRRDQQAKEKSK